MAKLNEETVSTYRVSLDPTAENTESQVRKLLDFLKSVPGGSDRLDLAFGVYIWNNTATKKIISSLRKRGAKNRIILGGPQITYTPPGELEAHYPEADIYIRGEAEETLPLVLESENRIRAGGLHYNGSEDDGSAAVPDLTTLPSPFLSSEPPINLKGIRKIRWETKRGCPYRCGFCQHGGRGSTRYFSKERILRELELFLPSDVRLLTIIDPIFHIGDTYLDIIEHLHRENFSGKISLQCHFELIETRFVEKLKGLDVCLEFGLQTIHDDEASAIGRRVDLDRISEIMRFLSNCRIHYEVDLIYGLPCQTVDSFRRSIEFCKDHNVPVIRAWPLILLRGTKLEAERERWGVEESREDIPKVTASSTFSETDWRVMQEMAEETYRESRGKYAGWRDL